MVIRKTEAILNSSSIIIAYEEPKPSNWEFTTAILMVFSIGTIGLKVNATSYETRWGASNPITGKVILIYRAI